MANFHIASVFKFGDEWQFGTWVSAAAPDFDALGVLWNASIIANIVPLVATDVQYMGCQIGDPLAAVTPGRFVAAPAATMGGGTGVSLPSVSCYCVTLYSDRRGKGANGRWFISGVSRADVLGNELDPIVVPTYQAAMGAFNAQLNGGGSEVRILKLTHVVTRPPTPPTVVHDSLIQAYRVRPRIREQRRREEGRSIRH